MLQSELASVIIPCYNQGRWLMDAIKSVLQQSYRPIEIIVIDDGSTDGTTNQILMDLNEHAQIRTVTQANQGVCLTRNRAIGMARGQYILPLDADDMIDQDFLSRAVALLQKNPSVDLVGGTAISFTGHTVLKNSYIQKCAKNGGGGQLQI